jgi:hypothetical protein
MEATGESYASGEVVLQAKGRARVRSLDLRHDQSSKGKNNIAVRFRQNKIRRGLYDESMGSVAGG